jgi:hypothetical protein
MKRLQAALLVLLFLVSRVLADEPKGDVKETRISAPNGVTIKVRMQGPYDIEIPLQTVCYFRHNKDGDKTLGAALELDTRLGGVIAALRDRNEFIGDELETLLLAPRRDTITPKQLLLIGLGDEESLSIEKMEAVGRVALRESARLGASRAAFAPLIRDQGNEKFETGDVAKSVLKGVLLAYDTEQRLQKEGHSKPFKLEEWVQEAGPKYFDETVAGAQKAIDEAKAEISKRGERAYSSKK